jgi:hypothetical protein
MDGKASNAPISPDETNPFSRFHQKPNEPNPPLRIDEKRFTNLL